MDNTHNVSMTTYILSLFHDFPVEWKPRIIATTTTISTMASFLYLSWVDPSLSPQKSLRRGLLEDVLQKAGPA